MSNPFIRREQPNHNERYRLARHNVRPSKFVPAFADLNDEELAIAQEWHDEAKTELKGAIEREERMAAFGETPEGQAARIAMRGEF